MPSCTPRIRWSVSTRGIKRRTDVVGIFPNETAIERLVGAVLLDNNDEWLTTRHDMPLQAMAKIMHSERPAKSTYREPQQTTARDGFLQHHQGHDPSPRADAQHRHAKHQAFHRDPRSFPLAPKLPAGAPLENLEPASKAVR